MEVFIRLKEKSKKYIQVKWGWNLCRHPGVQWGESNLSSFSDVKWGVASDKAWMNPGFSMRDILNCTFLRICILYIFCATWCCHVLILLVSDRNVQHLSVINTWEDLSAGLKALDREPKTEPGQTDTRKKKLCFLGNRASMSQKGRQ